MFGSERGELSGQPSRLAGAIWAAEYATDALRCASAALLPSGRANGTANPPEAREPDQSHGLTDLEVT